jgi:hypothetical protein
MCFNEADAGGPLEAAVLERDETRRDDTTRDGTTRLTTLPLFLLFTGERIEIGSSGNGRAWLDVNCVRVGLYMIVCRISLSIQ